MKGKPILLLVDDNKDDLLLLEHTAAASSNPCHIFFAKDGVNAIHLLKEVHFKPTLILLDIYMPEMSGFEFLKFIRASEELKTLPILMLTASRKPDDQELALALGADGYFTKQLYFKDTQRFWRNIWSRYDELHPK